MDRAVRSSKPWQVSNVLWIGLAVFALGSGPLLMVILAAKMGWTNDPNPNPVGFGIMAMFTFWPGIALVVGGLIITVARWLSAKVA